MSNYNIPMDAEKAYHIYNRTNSKELLFRDNTDRLHFFKKYKEYLLPYLDTFAYCLMGNHFHFLVRVKSVEVITKVIETIGLEKRTVAQRNFMKEQKDLRTTPKVISTQFTRLFTAYSMYFNQKYERKGNLFYRPFKRIEIEKGIYFTRLIYYIHSNSKHHKIQNDFRNYPWSSYQSILSDKPTNLKRVDVLEWFENAQNFMEFHHQREIDLSEIKTLMIEDD